MFAVVDPVAVSIIAVLAATGFLVFAVLASYAYKMFMANVKAAGK